MKVKLLSNLLYPAGEVTPAGRVLEVPDPLALEWIKDGKAERVAPPSPASPPPPEARGRGR